MGFLYNKIKYLKYRKKSFYNPYYKNWESKIKSDFYYNKKYVKTQKTNYSKKGLEGNVYLLYDRYFYNASPNKIAPYVVVKQKNNGSVYLSRIKTLKGKQKQIDNNLLIPFKYRYRFFNKDNGFNSFLTRKTKNKKNIFIFDLKKIKGRLYNFDYKNLKGFCK